MAETREIRLKRLRIRCWRRGMKEMDLILGGFADQGMADLDDVMLDAFEAMLSENDQDLYVWFSGQQALPDDHAMIIRHVQSVRADPGLSQA
ncbi:antitoxin CptB [Rubricella aquisinus]|uniref:FAD assembly factor SdhE n=1 Tax=Rubricella aquisinus TaxID=2028108 RepID=A0A840WLB9_9RHOB|nr:succinate dehydrogenase assembly factor 2 [Rubricella aquisinus]MBB5514943.1 antitoxin CptB [Rubricella aquisinus]